MRNVVVIDRDRIPFPVKIYTGDLFAVREPDGKYTISVDRLGPFKNRETIHPETFELLLEWFYK